MSEFEKYDAFIKRLEESYPQAMRNVYCGITINEGWYSIVELLVHHMQAHVSWKRNNRARDLRLNRAIKKGHTAVLRFLCGDKEPGMYKIKLADDYIEHGEYEVTEYVPHVEIHQIKEKFGGLRFYFEGGDAFCHGLETMAEVWAGRTCEVCGEKGKQRPGGWIRTLCDAHEADYQEKQKKRGDEYYA